MNNPPIESHPGSCDRVLRLATLTSAVLIALAMYVHLFFGVDYGDEGYHVSQPYRFVLGDRPFVDEWDFHLGFGLVAEPFYRPYVALFGTEGIVLFGRHGYWALTLLFAFVSWRCLKLLVPSSIALGGALVGVGFASATPSLSYDNLGISFFTCGVMLGVGSVQQGARWRWPLLAGLCHGIAAVAYFPMAMAVGAFAFVLALSARQHRWRILCSYVLGASVAGVPLFAAVWNSGLAAVYISYLRTIPLFGNKLLGIRKIAGLLLDLASCAKHSWWLALLGVATLIAVRRGWPKLTLVLLALYPFALLPMHGFGPARGFDSAVFGFVLYYGGAAAFLVPCVWSNRRLRAPALVIFSAATASAATMGYTSAGGYTRVAVGLLPAAILSLLLSGVLALDALSSAFPARKPRLWAVLLLVIVCAPSLLEAALELPWVLTVSEGRQTWVPISRLTRRMSSGPFMGIYADLATEKTLSTLAADLSAVPRNEHGRGLTVGRFNAGYLFLQRRPAARMVVGTWVDDIDELERTGTSPDVILIWRGSDTEPQVEDRLLDRALAFVARNPYEMAAQRPSYRLYVLRPALRIR